VRAGAVLELIVVEAAAGPSAGHVGVGAGVWRLWWVSLLRLLARAAAAVVVERLGVRARRCWWFCVFCVAVSRRL
jgi:hypothetical protein